MHNAAFPKYKWEVQHRSYVTDSKQPTLQHLTNTKGVYFMYCIFNADKSGVKAQIQRI